MTQKEEKKFDESVPVRVTVMPVCVTRPPEGPPRLLGLLPEQDARLSAALRRGGLPDAAAGRLLRGVFSYLEESQEQRATPLHRVGFFTTRDEGGPLTVELVYTAGLPWCLPEPPSDSWRPLIDHPPRSDGSGVRQEREFAVRDAWRQLAEESTHALCLLPPLFTIPEMQSVYEAIWGLEDLPNFHRWVGKNRGMVEEVPREELGAAAAEPKPVREQGANFAVPVGAMAVAALAASGSTLAYRNLRLRHRPVDAAERGKPPTFYKRGDRTPRLDAVFPPRPVWDWSKEDLILRALGGPKNVLSGSFEGAGPWGVRLRDAAKVHSDRLRQLGLVLDGTRQQVSRIID